jgi:uncharacterized glyoxalase superfamily protein PhnB
MPASIQNCPGSSANDAVAAKLKEHCTVVRDLHDMFYGKREIYVRDPDGYVLGFAQAMRGG